MSRSNHYYICDECTSVDEPCRFHEHPWSHYAHKPQRHIDGRRPWDRIQRWPRFSRKAWHSGPPRWWWQDQHAKYRQVCRQMMHHSDDPALPREQDVIDLWGWY